MICLFRPLTTGLLLIAFSAQTWAADPVRDLSSTALNFFLSANRTADFRSGSVKFALNKLKEEVADLFDQVLTEDGKKAFYAPAPVVLGQIALGANKSLSEALRKSLPSGKPLDLTKYKTGIAELDTLNAKIGATAIEADAASLFWIQIPDSLNPYVVAELYKTVSDVSWAIPNVVGQSREFFVHRTNLTTPTYIFNVGWGDCLSGCISNRRFYYEYSRKKAVKLAESGDILEGEAGSAKKYFK